MRWLALLRFASFAQLVFCCLRGEKTYKQNKKRDSNIFPMRQFAAMKFGEKKFMIVKIFCENSVSKKKQNFIADVSTHK